MSELAFQSATELTAAIRDRRIGSAELLEMYIERYERFNPRINAIIATDFENARIRAKQADAALDKGENWGPLHGLPMTIKDSMEVKGMPCTWGYPLLKDFRPERNAAAVQPLIDAGAVIFGKTNLPLFAMDFQSFNEVYGQTNNPWDLTRTPGGSSGGAAAALAAGLTGLEIGSDIGGSIRSPAHYCGVYGHKATYGVISLYGQAPVPGAFPGEYSTEVDIAVPGPLARSAADLDLVMDLVVHAPLPQRKAISIRIPSPRKETLKAYRIGLWLDDPAFLVDSSVGDCLQRAADRLAKAGALVEDKRPDIDFMDCHRIYTDLLNLATAVSVPPAQFEEMKKAAAAFSAEDRSNYAMTIRGIIKTHREWQELNYQRTMMRQKWADYFKEFDVLLCPVTRVAAFPHDHKEIIKRVLPINNKEETCLDALLPWVGLTGVSYLPATVAPVGFTAEGLPVGIQIVGPYLEDRTPIHVAGLMEGVTGGFTPPPGY
jgi:amidase